jgi:predicted MFS family arabinose efflux permease
MQRRADGGRAVAGVFFGKLSQKLRDLTLVLACCLLFAGYALLSFFQGSLAPILTSVFLVGASLSLFMPRVVFCVSTYSDATNSALTTLLISSVAPSMGGFLSPLIITNITEALSAGSTVFRYELRRRGRPDAGHNNRACHRIEEA